MRHRIVTFFISVSMALVAGAAEAGQIKSLQKNSSSLIRTIPSGPDGKFIQVCLNANEPCELFPNTNALAYGFKGTTSDWQNIFDHCASFEDLNKMALVSDALTSILLFWNVGWIKGIAVGVAWTAGTNTLAGDQAYPDIPKDTVNAGLSPINFVLQKDSSLFFDQEVIQGTANILKICTADFTTFMPQQIQSRCMRGCHQ